MNSILSTFTADELRELLVSETSRTGLARGFKGIKRMIARDEISERIAEELRHGDDVPALSSDIGRILERRDIAIGALDTRLGDAMLAIGRYQRYQALHPHMTSTGKLRATRRGKLVKCLETGEIFDSIARAAQAMGQWPTSLYEALKAPHRTCCGYHWKRVA